MKPNNNAKLKLNKHSISQLTKAEQQNVKAGYAEEDAAWTTSIKKCTGFLCCGPTETCTWTGTITATIWTILTF
jgi:hypothetical protein